MLVLSPPVREPVVEGREEAAVEVLGDERDFAGLALAPPLVVPALPLTLVRLLSRRRGGGGKDRLMFILDRLSEGRMGSPAYACCVVATELLL